MRCFHRLLSVAFILLVPLRSLIVAAVTTVVDAFPSYQPGASESLGFDRLTQRSTALPKVRSRFLAFVARLRLHDLFDGAGFHFDPGRAAA